MPSIVDDPEVGRRLGILRGDIADGSAPLNYHSGKRMETLSARAEALGHRLSPPPHWTLPLNRKCAACQMTAMQILGAITHHEDARCAYATMPILEHSIDPATASCWRCGAQREEFDDNLVPKECPQNRGALDKIIDARLAELRTKSRYGIRPLMESIGLKPPSKPPLVRCLSCGGENGSHAGSCSNVNPFALADKGDRAPWKVTFDDVTKAAMDMARRMDERRTKELAEEVFANFTPILKKPDGPPRLSDKEITRYGAAGAYTLAWLDLGKITHDSPWERVPGGPELISIDGSVITLCRAPFYRKVLGSNGSAPKAEVV